MGKRASALEDLGPTGSRVGRGRSPNQSAEGSWRGVRVLVTGHTGFKGAWLTLWLSALGADVHGLSLAPDDEPNLFTIASVESVCRSHIVDIRDRDAVARCVAKIQPQIVFHLAAQSLVIECTRDPVAAFDTNVLGTVNLLNALRSVDALSAILIATSDKVYLNDGSGRAFVESDPLGGADPYSASKAACEHVAASFRESYFRDRGVAFATARAGNVLGGGDFGKHRLAPDCVRASITGGAVRLRRPNATRPWQHVFDCLSGYLAYAALLSDKSAESDYPPSLNFGPDTDESCSALDLAQRLLHAMGRDETDLIVEKGVPAPDAPALSLDAGLSRRLLNLAPRLSLHAALDQTVEWTTAWRNGADMQAYCIDELKHWSPKMEIAS